MTKQEFMRELRESLDRLPENEVQEILRDHEEHFACAMESGRTEEEVASALGSPAALARGYLAQSAITRVEKAQGGGAQFRTAFQVFMTLLVLAPFNFIFVLGPYLGLVGILVGAWAASAALGIASLALIGKLIAVAFGAVAISFPLNASLFFLLVSGVGASLLLLMGMVLVTRIFAKGTLAYLKWNLGLFKTGSSI